MEIASAFVTIRPDASSFEAELVAAISGIGEQDISVTADTSDAEGAIDEVTGDVEVGVGADTSDAEAAIDGIESAPVEVPVTADTEQAQQSIDDLAGTIDAASGAAGVGGGAMGGLTTQIAGLTGVSTGATAGLGALVAGLGYAVSEGSDAQVTLGQLDQMVANMGANAGVTSGGLQSLATQLQQTAGFSDEAVMSGEAMVLMFENVRNVAGAPIFDRTIKSSADLARSPAFNGDIAGAARTLGRALDDPAAGMSRLRRANITFTEAQTAAITAMQESGDVAGAQAALLDVVDSKVGGLAERYGGQYAGGVDRAKEAVGEMAEALGAQMLPALDAVSESVIDQVQRLNSWDDALNGALLSGPIQAITGMGNASVTAAGNVTALPAALTAATDSTDSLTVAADAATAAVGGLDARIQGYLDGVFQVPEAERALRDSFTALEATLAQPARSADDVAVSLQGIVERTAALGTATGDMTGAVDAAVFGLAGLQAQGKLSAAEVAEVTSWLESIPGNTEGNVSTPGAPAARSQAQAVADALLGIPPYTRAVVVVDAVTSGIDAAGRAIAGLRADASRGITVTTHTSKESMGKVGAGVGRSSVSSVAPAALPPVQVVVDGQVVAEASFEHNRRLAMAEGYEQP